MPHPVHKIQL